jgi:hypothetical protein
VKVAALLFRLAQRAPLWLHRACCPYDLSYLLETPPLLHKLGSKVLCIKRGPNRPKVSHRGWVLIYSSLFIGRPFPLCWQLIPIPQAVFSQFHPFGHHAHSYLGSFMARTIFGSLPPVDVDPLLPLTSLGLFTFSTNLANNVLQAGHEVAI